MTTTYRPATRKMVSYLYRLMSERSAFAEGLEPYEQFMDKMETAVREQHPHAAYSTISAFIDDLKKITPDTVPARDTARVIRPATPNVPAGRYALVNSNDHKTYFFKVDRPTEGRWAGYTFVKRLSGDNELRIDRNESQQILAAISRDPLDAAARYGHETRSCGVCGRSLTDEDSRTLGIGPVCLKKFGDGAEDMAWKIAAARREAEQEQAAYMDEMNNGEF